MPKDPSLRRRALCLAVLGCVCGAGRAWADPPQAASAPPAPKTAEPSPWLAAAQRGDVATLSSLLDKGTKVDYQDGEGWSALMLAVLYGHGRAARTLLEAGADVNLQTSRGRTALMMAAARGDKALLERLLDDRRDSIGERRLLVLRELERDAPVAWADPTGLEVALAGLLDRALASLPERGDLFVATRRIDRAADGRPRLRILLRHHDPERRGAAELGAGDTSGLADVGAAANVLEYVLAETIVEASGGQLTVDATDGAETLILVDLPTPA